MLAPGMISPFENILYDNRLLDGKCGARIISFYIPEGHCDEVIDFYIKF